MKKGAYTSLFVILSIWMLSIIPVCASSKLPKIKDIEYEGKKDVEVEFAGRVRYRNVKVTVKECSTGKSYKAKIVEKESKNLTFTLKSAKAGKYQIKISGIRKKGRLKSRTIRANFRIAKKDEILVEEVEYSAKKKILSFDFQGSLHYENLKVIIKASDGKQYVKKIIKADEDDIYVKVKKLKSGKKYRYKITGVARAGSSNYKTVKGSFRP